MVGPVRGVQERLRARLDRAGAVQHQVPDADAQVRAAGFPGADDGAPEPGEPALECLRLCRLARGVPALERQEEAGHARFVVRFAGVARGFVVRAGVRLGAGPLARLSASICTAR